MVKYLLLFIPLFLFAQEQYPSAVIKDSLVIDRVLNFGHNADELFHGVPMRENPSGKEEHNWTLIETHRIHNAKYLIGTLAGIRVCNYCQRKEEFHYVLYSEAIGVTDQQIRELARRHE